MQRITGTLIYIHYSVKHETRLVTLDVHLCSAMSRSENIYQQNTHRKWTSSLTLRCGYSVFITKGSLRGKMLSIFYCDMLLHTHQMSNAIECVIDERESGQCLKCEPSWCGQTQTLQGFNVRWEISRSNKTTNSNAVQH